jgi:hypothetical protein
LFLCSFFLYILNIYTFFSLPFSFIFIAHFLSPNLCFSIIVSLSFCLYSFASHSLSLSFFLYLPFFL